MKSVDPVLAGAGVDTRTVAIKARRSVVTPPRAALAAQLLRFELLRARLRGWLS